MTIEKTAITAGESAAPPAKRRPGRPKGATQIDPADRELVPVDKDKLNPTGRKVLSLHLRGFRQKEIAAMLGLNEQHVSRICRERRYIEAFDTKLNLVDDEFLRLKPDAYRALANGLRSQEEAISLRAAEVYFKLTGQGGYGREGAGNGAGVSAEDIAQALLAAGGGTVKISAELHTEADRLEHSDRALPHLH
jgi:transcriptional regulator with XRE-family HTH domain